MISLNPTTFIVFGEIDTGRYKYDTYLSRSFFKYFFIPHFPHSGESFDRSVVSYCIGATPDTFIIIDHGSGTVLQYCRLMIK